MKINWWAILIGGLVGGSMVFIGNSLNLPLWVSYTFAGLIGFIIGMIGEAR